MGEVAESIMERDSETAETELSTARAIFLAEQEKAGGIIRALVEGMSYWGSQEDGIPGEEGIWDAYCAARRWLGMDIKTGEASQ